MNRPRPKSAKRRRAPQAPDDSRGRTNVPGQNPKANDATDQDVYHDDNRRNMFDPEVAKSLTGPGTKRR